MGGSAWAVVLAAGAGRRFGGPKLRAPFRGRPLAAHVATTLAAAIGRGILGGGVAVIPAGDTALAWAFDTAGLTLVEHPDAARGLGSSLQRGLAALEREPAAGAAVIVLADQPLLQVEVLARLVAEWRRSGRDVRPRYAGAPDTPGHPVLLARPQWALARQLEGDEGLGALLRAAPVPPTTLDVPGRNPDVDTTDDLSRLEDDPA